MKNTAEISANRSGGWPKVRQLDFTQEPPISLIFCMLEVQQRTDAKELSERDDTN